MNLKKLAFIFFFLLAPQVYSLEENSLGERAPLEAEVTIVDPEYSDYYNHPPEFGLLRDQQYNLEFTAENFVSYVDGEMELKIELPDDFELIEGDLQWSGIDKKKTIKILVSPSKNGDYNITATAKDLGLDWKNKQTILVKVGDTLPVPMVKSSVTDEITTSEGVILKDANLMANSERPTIQVAENYAHIHGVVYTYPYSNGRAYMLRGIQVELYDEDYSSTTPLKLATVYTVEPTIDDDHGLTPRNYVSGGTWYHDDDSGSFDFGDVYVGSDGMDYSIVVRYIFHDGGDGTTSGGTEKLKVVEQKNLHPDIVIAHKFGLHHIGSGEDSGIIGLGSKALGDSSYVDEATHVYYDIVKTYGYFRDFVGYTNQPIIAKLDPDDESAPDCPPDNCDHINFDFWKGTSPIYLLNETTDSIIHEYAHTIHYSMRGGSFPPLQSGDVNHRRCANSDSADALTEGWARLVSIIINKDPIYDWGLGIDPWDIRPNTELNGECDRSEYTFAAILWDIVEDVGGGSNIWFDHIADTLNNHDPNLVKEFHDDFISDWNHASNVQQVFMNHNVDYYPPLITNIRLDPTPLQNNVNFTIKATISDVSFIQFAHAAYSTNNWVSWTWESMNYDSNTKEWATDQIPALPSGTEISYGVCAQDFTGVFNCEYDKALKDICPAYPPPTTTSQEKDNSYATQSGTCDTSGDYSVIVGCTDAEPPPKPSSVTITSNRGHSRVTRPV